MPVRKARARWWVLPAALILCLAVPGPVPAEPLEACQLGAGEDIVFTGEGEGPVLWTADGREMLLAGVAFPQVIDPEIETATAAEVAGLAAGQATLVEIGPPDRYGRLRAHVVLADGRWLQAELVRSGLALVRPDGTAPGCVTALLAAETSARADRAGLWADSNNAVKVADDPSLLAENGLYRVVEGRVVSVGYGSRMVFLDFGRDIRTDFTVMVPNALVPRLVEAGIALERLRGREVRVRGVIEESGGPAIRIADPYALELLDRTE
jgi:hypothetical protein